MPTGILENIDLIVYDKDLEKGDIIVMCTDGVLETKDSTKNGWIENFLCNLSTGNVQKIADLIIAEAIDNNYGAVKDDMTVIVSKVVKRK